MLYLNGYNWETLYAFFRDIRAYRDRSKNTHNYDFFFMTGKGISSILLHYLYSIISNFYFANVFYLFLFSLLRLWVIYIITIPMFVYINVVKINIRFSSSSKNKYIQRNFRTKNVVCIWLKLRISLMWQDI